MGGRWRGWRFWRREGGDEGWKEGGFKSMEELLGFIMGREL